MPHYAQRPLLTLLALFATGLAGPTRLSHAEDNPWVDVRQLGPFICAATFPLAEYEPLFAELPGLQQELARTLGVPPLREPVYIYLFADADQHRAYIEQRFPHVPYRRALYIKENGQSGVYAYRDTELAIDLRHECTHALLHASLSYVPLWLDEGLAEYFEVPPSRRAFDHPHFESLVWNMRLGMVRPVEALEQIDDLSQMEGVDYRYSWAWVHFMLHGPKPAHRVLVGYLADIQRGTAPASAFSERLNQAVAEPTEKMVHHFKHWRR